MNHNPNPAALHWLLDGRLQMCASSPLSESVFLLRHASISGFLNEVR